MRSRSESWFGALIGIPMGFAVGMMALDSVPAGLAVGTVLAIAMGLAFQGSTRTTQSHARGAGTGSGGTDPNGPGNGGRSGTP